MPATNPQTLFTDSACKACYGASSVELLELALLDQISQTIGGGGGATFFRITEAAEFRITQAGDRRITH